MHIACDIGNVLVHLEYDTFVRSLSRYNGTNSEEDTLNYLRGIEKLDYCGLISRTSMFKKDFKLDDIESLRLMIMWDLILKRNDQMINFIQKLKDQNVKIALLSNIAKEHHECLKNICPELFDKTILHFSYDVGVAKPSLLYYQSFLMSNEDFVGCVYLDDIKENLVTGSKMKFESIHFDLENLTKNQPPSVLKKKLDEIYNKVVYNF